MNPNYFDQKKREKEEITQANYEEKPNETIEGRKTGTGERGAEKTAEQGRDGRRRQQNTAEEKERRKDQKNLEKRKRCFG